MESKILLAQIEQATNQSLPKPDPDLNLRICSSINQIAGISKDAVAHLKGRIIKKNPKIQLLAIELLSTAMRHCKLPFHIQVASKSFLPILSKLAKMPDAHVEVKGRILELIQEWAQRFEDQADVLPLFQGCYQELRKVGVHFPNTPAEPSKPVKPSPKLKVIEPPKSRENEFNKKDKYLKVRQSWKILIDNMKVANEIIDAEDYRYYSQNEILVDMITVFKSSERNLLDFLSNCTDYEMKTLGKKIKAELGKTFSRYTDLKSHRRPEPFTSMFAPAAIEKPIPPAKVVEEPKEVPVAKSAEVFDLFGENNAEPKRDEKEDIEEEIIHSPIKPVPSPESKPKKDDPLTRLNEIMAKMKLEEDCRAEEESKKKIQHDPLTAAFPPTMMGGSWPYATNMPYMPPMMGYPGNYATNVGFNPMMGNPMMMRPNAPAIPELSKPTPVVPSNPPVEKVESAPAPKDEFADLFEMANSSLTSKKPATVQRKPADMLFSDEPLPKVQVWNMDNKAPTTNPSAPPANSNDIFDLF